MPKSLGEPEVLPKQMLMTRDYLKILFSPAAAARPVRPVRQIAEVAAA